MCNQRSEEVSQLAVAWPVLGVAALQHPHPHRDENYPTTPAAADLLVDSAKLRDELRRHFSFRVAWC